MGDETLQILEDYIKKGLDRGFNIEHIKGVLTNHGHDPGKVEVAAQNILGMRTPDHLNEHLDDHRPKEGNNSHSLVVMVILVIILALACITLGYKYFSDRSTLVSVQEDLSELEELGIGVGEITTELKANQALLKQKDRTIEEKEQLIEDQIERIEEAQKSLEEQRVELNSLLLDLINRIIGRING